MLRITETIEDGNTVRLRLDGRLAQESFEELAKICRERGRNTGNVIVIDMAGVTFMNNETAERLLGLRGERLRIINGSPFVDMLLHSKESNFAGAATALLKQANRPRSDGND